MLIFLHISSNLAYIICLIDALVDAVVHIARKLAQACAGEHPIQNEEERPNVPTGVNPTQDVQEEDLHVELTVNVQLNKEEQCRTRKHTTHRHGHHH